MPLAIFPFYWWLLSDCGHKKLGNNVGEFFSIIRSKKEKDDHRYMIGTFPASDFHPFRKRFCTVVRWGGEEREKRKEREREKLSHRNWRCRCKSLEDSITNMIKSDYQG